MPSGSPRPALGLRAATAGVFLETQTASQTETHAMLLTRWLRNLRSACHGYRTDRPRPALRFRPRLEALEDRAVPAQINLTVNSPADAGPYTLRDAIQSA